MVKILIKETSANVLLLKRPSPYSIIKKVCDNKYLKSGWNEISDLKYGFYIDLFYHPDYVEKIDVSKYDTSNIVDMSLMFAHCSNLKELNVSNFDTRRVVDMYGAFRICHSLVKLDLSNFNTSNVSNMAYMFYGCLSLQELDLSNFSVKNVIYNINMFRQCPKLKYIKCTEEFKDWCLKYQSVIGLPLSMREGGDGIWDIID